MLKTLMYGDEELTCVTNIFKFTAYFEIMFFTLWIYEAKF